MMSGNDTSWPAAAARVATRIIDPFYSSVMRFRNALYDTGIFPSHDLGRPTISVGNITTGGTGKTPVVQWLCQQLQQRAQHPAVLLRGYGTGAFSDEAELLKQSLKDVPVHANSSRVAGAAAVLNDNPTVNLFVLDDAFQHRKVRRNFNLVLISATQPFGFGHVLPRGLLRESLKGLKRADAFLITRSSLAPVETIDRFLKDNHPAIPVYHSDHQVLTVRDPILHEVNALNSYEGERVFLTAGIGDPAAFEQQIRTIGCHVVGTRWFADHHIFTSADLTSIDHVATSHNADIVLTTEKDWVKIKRVTPQASNIPLGIVNLSLTFTDNDAENLLTQITTALSVRGGRLEGAL